jgi:lipopolysaccharide transport system permease protein
MNKSKLVNSEWDMVIEGKSPFLDFKFKEVWKYRDLLMLFVKRDFVSFYKQTIFGPLWFFIQPVFTTIVFTFIFSNLANISTDGVPAPLFYLAGITAWNYFADCITKTSTVFKDNSNLFGKVYFPRLILPLSIVVSNLIRFFVQFSLFIAVLFFYKYLDNNLHFTWVVFLFPVLLLMMAMLGLGMGLIITGLTTKYRDLAFLVTFGIQLLMYTTTVIYPLNAAPTQFKFFINLNPMTPIIEAFRLGFMGQGSFSADSFLFSVLFVLVLFFSGVFIFQRTERNFVDTI